MTEERAENFYDALAPMFDVMTDWEARLAGEMPFLQAILADLGGRRVLDAACGSGGHALALAQLGYEVSGADISAGMVHLARGKAAEAERSTPFAVAGLAALTDHYPAASFDAVLCLGNSLPHLLTDEDLAAGLRGMAQVLRPGGLLVTQALNYDLRWQTQPRFFGAQGGQLEGQEVLVWRFADYEVPERRIAFHIALFRKTASTWDVQVHTTAQRPLQLDEMLVVLESEGYADVRAYGRMAWPPPPFAPDASGDLVLVARRQ